MGFPTYFVLEPATPEQEAERLRALYCTQLLDTSAEECFDRITRDEFLDTDLHALRYETPPDGGTRMILEFPLRARG